ncbi:MAG: FprA family A-type flavoprotein, partial [Desulfovibrionales bacterium]
MPVHEIKKDIHWVGVVDWNLRNFHGYSLARRGTTYNAFLAMDEKITLFDTVAKRFSKEFLHQLRKVVDPEKIDYIVVNHVEPDHSGSLAEVVELVRPEKIFCSKMGEKAIRSHYHPEDWPLIPVENGQSITLGKNTVQFLETRMLHWPDSMFSYIPEQKLLISSDAFGQNWATSERFDDEVDQDILFREAGAYFANIILPYSALVKKVLSRVQEAGIAIDMIAPDHGLIWRSDIQGILSKYVQWSEQKPANKAVIVYDTMWRSTEKMARSLAEGLIREGVDVRIMHLKSCHHSDVMAEILDAGAVLVGSPTHNNTILPLVAGMLTYMKGLRPQNKIGLAFGSFGWSGESVKQISGFLEEMEMEVMEP